MVKTYHSGQKPSVSTKKFCHIAHRHSCRSKDFSTVEYTSPAVLLPSNDVKSIQGIDLFSLSYVNSIHCIDLFSLSLVSDMVITF